MNGGFGLAEPSIVAPFADLAVEEPLVALLSPPRSFSSVGCAMLGQHPQLYGLAETHLLAVRTVGEWWSMSATANFPMTDGLVRSVAEIVWGAQTADTVTRAAAWLRARPQMPACELLRLLRTRVWPRILVEKSPLVVFRPEWIRRAAATFPNARFVHLTRHPRGYAQSVSKHIRESTRGGDIPGWLRNLGWSDGSGTALHSAYDPQRSWLALHTNIDDVLLELPAARWTRVRGEDLLQEPDATLTRLAEWLGIRRDADAVEQMKHPERSPFAAPGPPGARFGGDVFFLRSPSLRPARAEPLTLDGALEWRPDGAGFDPRVHELARRFGYT